MRDALSAEPGFRTGWAERAARAFPLWLVGGSVLAVVYPASLAWYSGSWITWSLGAIMLLMGTTLSVDDFRRVLTYPRWVAIGFALQFSVMPIAGYSLGRLLRLPDPLLVGLILVASCPGGTASNVIAFLARANTALSVTLTALSTIAATVMTPWLTATLAGSRMDVNALDLVYSTAQVVLLPVALGSLISRRRPDWAQRCAQVGPLLSVVLITLIVASILGRSFDMIVESGWRLIVSVLGLHVVGFVGGYATSRWLTKSESVARTVAIEVGMQNSGLGAHLARAHFPAGMGFDVPSALSALTHCIFGSVCASWWQRRPPRS